MTRACSWNRTVFIGLDAAGADVIDAVDRRLAHRLNDSAGSVPVATLSLSADGSRNERVEGLVERVREALRVVSRITPAGSDVTEARPGPRSRVVDLYLVAAVDGAGDELADVAFLLRHCVRRLLNAPARITGCLLLPDPLVNGKDGAAESAPSHRLDETPAQLDRWMQPHDGYSSTFGDTTIEGWGPAFDGPCYLIGALNENGLALATPEARNEMVAEGLFLLSMTAMGRAASSLAPARPAARRPGHGRYASFGVGAIYHPVDQITHHCARSRAADRLGRLCTDVPSTSNALDAERFLTAADLSPDAICQDLLPAELYETQADTILDRLSVAWTDLSALPETFNAMAAEHVTRISALRSDLIHRLPTSWPALLRHVIWPPRCLRLWRTWRRFVRARTAYAACLERERHLQAELLRYDVLQRYVQAAGAVVSRRVDDVQSLMDVLVSATARLQIDVATPFRATSSFDLEWCVTPSARLDRPCAGRGPTEMPAVGPDTFCEWIASTPTVEAVIDAATTHARSHLNWSAEESGMDVLMHRLPKPEAQRAFVRNLMYACAPFSGGHACMEADDGVSREIVVVGVPAGFGDVFVSLESETPFSVKVVSQDDLHRINVLRVRFLHPMEEAHV